MSKKSTIWAILDCIAPELSVITVDYKASGGEKKDKMQKGWTKASPVIT